MTSIDALCLVMLLAVAARVAFANALSVGAVSAWTTVFAAICVQAAPFVALGVLVSTVIAVAVPARFFTRALPTRYLLSVPVAGLSGMLLPGCECGSVPIAAALMRRGVSSAPAVAFMLTAPAINPVVLVATAVAFPGQPAVVVARFLASLLSAILIGWVWQRVGRACPAPRRLDLGEHESMWTRVHVSAGHDLAQSIGLLAVGAASAATLKVGVPPSWLHGLGGSAATGVLVLAVLAVGMAICSEADAFIAASLTQFSMTARLAFMVVGPAVDLKLIAMQIGTFGTKFTRRFAPLSFVMTLLVASCLGTVMV